MSRPKLYIALILALVPPSFGQGPLAPPGPPSASLKSLSQIEPRTDIASLPPVLGVRTISQPGSYYLTGNLVGESILVQASHVTIDLGGFAIFGGAASGSGIVVDPSASAIRLLNGSISGWTQYGINLGTSSDIRIENLAIDSCGADGVFGQPTGAQLQSVAVSNSGGGAALQKGKGNTIRGCRFVGLTYADAILSADLVEDTVVTACSTSSGSPLGAVDGFVVMRCAVSHISFGGARNCVTGTIVTETAVATCSSSNYIFGISAAIVSRCSVQGISSSGGMVVGIGSSTRVDGCEVANLTTAPAGGDGH